MDLICNSIKVSIRASLQQRGELVISFRFRIGVGGFNPRLTSAARRTFVRIHRFSPMAGFNPRLTSAARRTPLAECASFPSIFHTAPHYSSEENQAGELYRNMVVSIRASLQQRGERIITDLYPSIFRVSIRASLQQRGEPWTKSFPSKKRKCFNPRLTSAARRTPYLLPPLR